MVNKNVKDTFARVAKDYDVLIEKVVPNYHEQHKVILSFIPFARSAKLKVLDLGIGTGSISHVLLKNYPNSHVDGIDISGKMIGVCQKRLGKFGKRLRLFCGDIEKTNYDSRYDVVTAGLTIHHLTDRAKERFFRKIQRLIRHNGVFIIRDLIKTRSSKINKLYNKLWSDFERSNGLDPKKISKEGKQNDIPSTVEDHLLWLKKAGFKDVDCVWKYNNFAIIVAYK